LDANGEPTDPSFLFVGGGGQQKHFASAVWIVVEFAGSQGIIVVDVLFVDFNATPGSKDLFKNLQILR
jgi:hypothetical protein